MANEKQSNPDRASLEARMEVIETLVVRLAQQGVLEEVVGRGFHRMSRRMKDVSQSLDRISVQMKPFAALGPGEATLTPDQDARVRRLERALVAPDPTEIPVPWESDIDYVDQQRSAS